MCCLCVSTLTTRAPPTFSLPCRPPVSLPPATWPPALADAAADGTSTTALPSLRSLHLPPPPAAPVAPVQAPSMRLLPAPPPPAPAARPASPDRPASATGGDAALWPDCSLLTTGADWSLGADVLGPCGMAWEGGLDPAEAARLDAALAALDAEPSPPPAAFWL